MDMDGFKDINDRYGHSAGDEALRLAARLSVDALRSCDIVGRIGGDEFAFVFPECDEAGAAAAADKVRKVVGSATFASGSGLVTLSASIGTVGSSGPSHIDLEEFLSLADERMYIDKALNKARNQLPAPRRRMDILKGKAGIPRGAGRLP
jgi:diguanylate cyclase (GGDEF)-like protein